MYEKFPFYCVICFDFFFKCCPTKLEILMVNMPFKFLLARFCSFLEHSLTYVTFSLVIIFE